MSGIGTCWSGSLSHIGHTTKGQTVPLSGHRVGVAEHSPWPEGAEADAPLHTAGVGQRTVALGERDVHQSEDSPWRNGAGHNEEVPVDA